MFPGHKLAVVDRLRSLYELPVYSSSHDLLVTSLITVSGRSGQTIPTNRSWHNGLLDITCCGGSAFILYVNFSVA